MLNTTSPAPGGQGNHARAGSHSRSASVAGRRSAEIINEEDEDEVEEVDAFSPITGDGEVVEETIYPSSAAYTPMEPDADAEALEINARPRFYS